MSGATQAHVSVHLFGSAYIALNGEALRFSGGRKAWSLFCYLALRARTPLARDTVAFTLWPDLDEDDAKSTFRRELNRMTKALPTLQQPWLEVDDITVVWNKANDVEIDVQMFSDCASDDQRYSDAIQLYTGDLLVGIHDDWVFADRERFRSMYMHVLSLEIARARSERDYSSAIRFAQRMLLEDPFREDVVRMLIRLRHEAGDRAGALHDASLYEQRYREELGCAFMPETQALREAIQRGEATHAKTFEVHAPAKLEAPFVGRSTLLQRATAQWKRAAQGRGGTIFISGEPGIGKSRFLRELGLRAEAQGARVLCGFTSNPEHEPYEAVATALREVLGLLANVGVPQSDAARLAKIVPEFSRFVSATPEVADSARDAGGLFRALLRYVHALASTRPLIILLEDLHWARPSTLAAIRSLIADAQHHPILIVIAHRSTEYSDALKELRNDALTARNAITLSLEGLSDVEAQAMIANLSNERALDADIVSRLVQVSGGNPLLIVESLAKYTKDGTLPDQQVDIASSVEARLFGATQGALDVAQIAANFGERLRFDDIQRISGLNDGFVLDGISELIERGILRESIGRNRYHYVFSHNLIRRAIYEKTPIEIRKQRHFRIARMLEKDFVDDPTTLAADIAYHFEAALDHEAAARWYLRAAARARELYANAEALTFLNRVLSITQNDTIKFSAYSDRELIHARLGNKESQRIDITAMDEMSSSLGTPAEFTVLRRRLAHALLTADFDDVAHIAEKMMQYPDAMNEESRADITIARARVALDRGDYTSVEPILDDLTTGQVAAFARVEALCLLAEVSGRLGDFEKTRSYLRNVEQATIDDNADAFVLARSSLVVARIAVLQWQFHEAESFARRARELFLLTEEMESVADASMVLAASLVRLLRFAEAVPHYDEAASIYEKIGKPLGVAAVRTNFGVYATWIGRIDEAKVAFDCAIQIFTKVGDRRGEAVCLTNLSMIALHEERYSDARDFATQAITLARETANPILEGLAMANLGTAERELGKPDVAIATLERCLELRAKASAREDLINDIAELALAYAMVGRHDEACELADEVVMHARAEQGAIVWFPYALWAVTRVYEYAKVTDKTRSVLQLAHVFLSRQLDLFDDELARERFAALPAHRAILSRISP